ncbi:MAG UNVERIFIED_CONTAM: hypothetical protein LVR18_13485 [Planctomycetaceae bacterium]
MEIANAHDDRRKGRLCRRRQYAVGSRATVLVGVCDEAEQLRTTYLEEFGLRSIVFRSEPSAQINWLLKLLQINYRITPEVAVYLDLWVGKDKILDLFLSTLGLSRVTDG